MRDLSKLAAAVVATLAQDQLVKQSEVTYTLKTEAGQLLQKVAEQLRIENSSNITYTDLARFRKAYDV